MEGVQHKVRETIKYGADLIKICATGGVLSHGDNPQASQYTLEEMKAIVADAHRLGRKVAAHAHGAQGILWASQAGVDSIEHGSYIDDAAIAEMKKNGTYLVPTLYLADWFLDNAERLHVPPEMIAKGSEVMPAARKNVAHAFASGVKVAFGTDAAVYPHGLNAHEFAVMVKLGLSPLQSIQSATINAADLLGWSDKIGAVEPGKWADIIAVDGDPLAGRDHARAREVRDEGRRSSEERIREVKTGSVGRTLLSAAFEVALAEKEFAEMFAQVNIKSRGQECPPHTKHQRPASQPAFYTEPETKTTSWGRWRLWRLWRRGTLRPSWP